MPLIELKEFCQAYLSFFRSYKFFSIQNDGRFELSWKSRRPYLYDATSFTGFDRHYVYHTAWAARKLEQIKPKVHFDFGSSIFFASIVSAHIPIRFFDYRPPKIHLSGLTSEHANLNQLDLGDASVESISCMHVIEHIGLGRYGDPINPRGDCDAASELKRILACGGSLLVVVPVGKPKIEFNAHRIYSYDQVISMFDGLEVVEFSLIQEGGNEGLVTKNAEKDVQYEIYGCGCFWFKKVG